MISTNIPQTGSFDSDSGYSGRIATLIIKTLTIICITTFLTSCRSGEKDEHAQKEDQPGAVNILNSETLIAGTIERLEPNLEQDELQQRIKDYQNRLKIRHMDRVGSGLYRISVRTSTPDKEIAFLNILMEKCLQAEMERKTGPYQKTIEYIDAQLEIIADSLKIAEANLHEYRTRHQVINISQESTVLYEQIQELDREKATMMVNVKYYEYIIDYFEQNTEFFELIPPSALGIENVLLNNMIRELKELNTRKVSLVKISKKENPDLKRISIQMDNLRNTIDENIKSALNTANIGIQDLEVRIAQVESELRNLSQPEKELIDIERDYNLNDATYSFLLEKRAEARIALAGTVPDSQIIEPAYIESSETQEGGYFTVTAMIKLADYP